ncbi:MAG TPA: class E sortase [Baekduia sp.]|nr:class E sortase [Baekduia sp.]
MAVAATSRRRRVLRGLSTILIVAGGLIVLDGALTVLWQEPLTALQTRLRQDHLRGDLQRLERSGPTPIESRALRGLHDDRQRIAFLARSLRRRAQDGDAIGRIEIPKIGADFVLVKGSKPEDLRRGPGTYDQTPLPGVPGTSAIAGHRTTYLAPFRRIDELSHGDRVVVTMPYATFTYRVERTQIVDPDALWVLRRVRYDRLVLSACHPLFSAAQRIIVFARLDRVVPAAAVRAGRGSDSTAPSLSSSPG